MSIISPAARLRRGMAALVCVSLLTLTSAFAQTAPAYEIELVVTKGKKSVETDADIIFEQEGFRVVPDKKSFADATREFAYADIKQADHSYSKKPMLSAGGAIAAALVIGLFALPFLFIKKKKHWMTVQTETDYAVMKLGDKNYRQIVAEFETRGVTVADLKEEGK